MRTKVPKEKRNETLTLSDRKHFAAMITRGFDIFDTSKLYFNLFISFFQSRLRNLAPEN